MRSRWFDAAAVLLLLAASAEIVYLNKQVKRLRKETQELEAIAPADITRGIKLLPLSGRDLSGTKTLIEAGLPYLIFFFSPSCGACEKVLPGWRAVTSELGAEHTLLLIPEISADTRGESEKYVRTKNLRRETAVLVAYADTKRFRLLGVPRLLLVDAQGKVVTAWRGSADPEELIGRWMDEARKGGNR